MNSMHFLSPYSFLWLLVIPLLVLLHLIGHRSRVRLVSSLSLWRWTGSKRMVNRFTRIKRNWLLPLQILTVALMALALTRPVVNRHSAAASEKILIFDVSASMLTLERDQTRLDLARSEAERLIAESDDDDRFWVIRSGVVPQVLGKGPMDRGEVENVMEALEAGHYAADIEASLDLVSSLTKSGTPFEVFLLTDGAGSAAGAWAHLYPNLPLRVIQVGSSDKNVAISRFTVKRNPMSPYDGEAFLEIENFSQQAFDLQWRVGNGAGWRVEERVTLSSNERKSMHLPVDSTHSGVLVGEIDVADDLRVDNRAFALWGPQRLRILLLTNGNSFLEAALGVDRWIAVEKRGFESFDGPIDTSGYDAVILDHPPRDYRLPVNQLVVVGSGTVPSGLAQDRGEISILRVTHPVMRFVELRGLHPGDFVGLGPAGEGTLAECNGQAILTAVEVNGRRIAQLGLRTNASHFPQTPEFPVLVANLIRWLSPENEHSSPISTGQTVHLLSRDTDVVVNGPQGTRRYSVPKGGRLVFDDTELGGIYSVEGARTTARFAVNFFDEQESNIRPVPEADLGEVPSSFESVVVSSRSDISDLLIVLALLGALLETVLFKLKGRP